MTCRDKYSLRNRDNLEQPFQKQLSQKQEIFSEFFFAFLKSRLNFELFPKKEEPQRKNEKMYAVNFTDHRKKCCLSLHYNGANCYLFANSTEIIKFKAKILILLQLHYV